MDLREILFALLGFSNISEGHKPYWKLSLEYQIKDSLNEIGKNYFSKCMQFFLATIKKGAIQNILDEQLSSTNKV